MNTSFLGDAFDHWKGSVIRSLSDAGLLKSFAIEPMFTNTHPWSAEDLRTYCGLLTVSNSEAILHRQTTFVGPRNTYFHGIPSTVDLFLDPDTGIAVTHSSRKHIKLDELNRLLSSDATNSRLLIVYQHSGHGSFHTRLQKIGTQLKHAMPAVHYCIYECGRVALLFLSLDHTRIIGIKSHLRTILAGTAVSRIWGT